MGLTAAQCDLSIKLPSQPIWIEGDAVRLEQVFANLLDNAVKHNQPGGRIDLTLETASSRDQAGMQAIVRIQDTDVGLQPDQLSKIFEFFARVDVAPARRTSGLGIGLSLAKNLVELHSGTIEASSPGLGKGSTFTVRLPIATEVKALEPSGHKPSQAERVESSASRRILAIDDNSDAAEAVAQPLQSLGHNVQIALSAPEGIQVAAAFKPEVTFVDIAMPNRDGYEVAAQLRRQNGL
jgi:two-component system, sensor histidine kinase